MAAAVSQKLHIVTSAVRLHQLLPGTVKPRRNTVMSHGLLGPFTTFQLLVPQRLGEAEAAASGCKERMQRLEEAAQAAGSRTIEQVPLSARSRAAPPASLPQRAHNKESKGC